MKSFIFTILFTTYFNASAITLEQATDKVDKDIYDYQVLFTNPVCEGYKYEFKAKDRYGRRIFEKPKGAWCESKDASESGKRWNSPQNRLISWINDPETKEVFFTYLSFSNSAVTKALVENIESRNLKVTFIIDHTAFCGTRKCHSIPADILEKSRDAITSDSLDDKEFYKFIFKKKADSGKWTENSKASKALQILNAKPKNKSYAPKLYLRGHQSGIGYSHNKLFVINPNSNKEVRYVFSSGNMSSGIILHHENWHFIKTVKDTYFAQAHECLIDGMIKEGQRAKDFKNYISKCKSEIEFEEETDIKTYFVPAEGDEAWDIVKRSVKSAESIDMAAHRFLHHALINLLESEIRSKGLKLNLVVDDDIFWTRFDDKDLPPKRYSNNVSEYNKVFGLSKAATDSKRNGIGGQFSVHYMETNHFKRFGPLLHHNKFMVFNDSNGRSTGVFAGAGNFTLAAFTKNYENFYFVTTPSVLKQFEEQYDYLWEISTSSSRMPTKNALPNGDSPAIER